jgi:hypothetical protein
MEHAGGYWKTREEAFDALLPGWLHAGEAPWVITVPANSIPQSAESRIRCDGDHAMPPCGDPQCWHSDPPPEVVAEIERITTESRIVEDARSENEHAIKAALAKLAATTTGETRCLVEIISNRLDYGHAAYLSAPQPASQPQMLEGPRCPMCRTEISGAGLVLASKTNSDSYARKTALTILESASKTEGA